MIRNLALRFKHNTSAFHPSQTCTLKNKLILVDLEGNYISPIQKEKAHTWEYISNGGNPHLAFSVFLFDKGNRLLMQKRSSYKILFPLKWTNSCCSHPQVLTQQPLELQTQVDAINKRVPFQLGMSIDKFPLVHKGNLLYQAQGENKSWGEYELDDIYFCRIEGQPAVNKEQVEATCWVSYDQMSNFVLNNQDHLTPWFLQIYRGNLMQWWSAWMASGSNGETNPKK